MPKLDIFPHCLIEFLKLIFCFQLQNTAGSPQIQILWLYFSPLLRNYTQYLTANNVWLVIMGTDQAIVLSPDLEAL